MTKSRNDAATQELVALCREKSSKAEDIIRLIDKGADVNFVGGSGVTPLLEAVSFAHEDVVKVLIARGADIHASSEHISVGLGSRGVPDILQRAINRQDRGIFNTVLEALATEKTKTLSNEAVQYAKLAYGDRQNTLFKGLGLDDPLHGWKDSRSSTQSISSGLARNDEVKSKEPQPQASVQSMQALLEKAKDILEKEFKCNNVVIIKKGDRPEKHLEEVQDGAILLYQPSRVVRNSSDIGLYSLDITKTAEGLAELMIKNPAIKDQARIKEDIAIIKDMSGTERYMSGHAKNVINMGASIEAQMEEMRPFVEKHKKAFMQKESLKSNAEENKPAKNEDKRTHKFIPVPPSTPKPSATSTPKTEEPTPSSTTRSRRP